MRSLFNVLLCVTLGLLMVACERAPSTSQVVGTYTGSLNGASEILTLHLDGTFSQEVRPTEQVIRRIGSLQPLIHLPLSVPYNLL